MAAKNRGEDVARQIFEFCIKFFRSRAVLVDGSTQYMERDMVVKWEVELEHVDPQEQEKMGEAAVRNLVEKIGERVVWGPDQEVSLLRFEEWKGQYVRVETGQQMVDEIDVRDGWTSKSVMFLAELVDRKSDSRVGYVASKLSSQMVEDDWAAQRHSMPLLTELAVLTVEADGNAEGEAADANAQGAAQNNVTVD